MGQLLDSLGRVKPEPKGLSYSLMVRAYLEATKGAYHCDRIECSPEVMARFLELASGLYVWPEDKPRKLKCAYCRREDDVTTRNCKGCGAPLIETALPRVGPPKFMGAEMAYGTGLRRNEMRFINTRCPDYSGRLLLEM